MCVRKRSGGVYGSNTVHEMAVNVLTNWARSEGNNMGYSSSFRASRNCKETTRLRTSAAKDEALFTEHFKKARDGVGR